MATKNSVVKVSPAGHLDGDIPALINVPDFDPAHFVAPGAGGTWTNITGVAASQDTGSAAAGYVVIQMGSTLYRIQAFLTT